MLPHVEQPPAYSAAREFVVDSQARAQVLRLAIEDRLDEPLSLEYELD